MRTLAVIPARLASTRLPEKALLPLGGRPIVQWVHDATLGSGMFDRVVVATDDARIAEAVAKFGGDFLMTSAEHSTGSERVAEAAAMLPETYDVVANVQGDQPFVSHDDLRSLLRPYAEGQRPDMTTLAAPMSPELEKDPNSVKVVADVRGRALYFSRSPIPAAGPGAAQPRLRHHLGLYAFRADFLPIFAQLAPTPLEQAERLEQLRAIEHGCSIVVCDAVRSTVEVNTQEDYERAVAEVSSRGES